MEGKGKEKRKREREQRKADLSTTAEASKRLQVSWSRVARTCNRGNELNTLLIKLPGLVWCLQRCHGDAASRGGYKKGKIKLKKTAREQKA